MKAQKKQISYDTALKARALFTMAADHYRKAAEFEAALGELLGYTDDDGYSGWFSDEAVSNGSFDKAMKMEGFIVRPKGKSR